MEVHSSKQQPESLKNDTPVSLSEVVRLMNADFPRTVAVNVLKKNIWKQELPCLRIISRSLRMGNGLRTHILMPHKDY